MDEYKKEEEMLYEISPKFNLVYEFFMPTGRKIKSTIIGIILMFAVVLIFTFGKDFISVKDIIVFGSFTVLDLFSYLIYICIALLVIKLAFHIVMQTLQYKHISYKFFSSHMVYEDDFLNQHRKNIEYSNVKEVEIRRTIWDRILGYGVIVIYTNAENDRSNGLVIYGIKDPKSAYDKIYGIVRNTQNISTETPINSSIDPKNEIYQNENNEKTNGNLSDIPNNINMQNSDNQNIKIDNLKDFETEEARAKRLEEAEKKEKAFEESLKDVN